MAQQQKVMLYVFPIIYAMSSVVIPIGVLLYWLASNVWTMAQQGILIRNNPAPNTPAYIDWEERMRAKGLDPDQIMRERREKSRRKNKRATNAPTTRKVRGQDVTPTDEVDETTNPTPPKVQRQQVTRSTVRVDADGKRVVTRQQPRQQSRAKRKKK